MLTNLESLRQYLGLDEGDTQNDDLMFEIIKSTSKKINSKLNRNLEAQDYINSISEYYTGDGTNKLLLKQYPVNVVYSIFDDVDRVFSVSTQEDPASIVISYQCPGLIQLKGNIFINSEWWTYYNLENIKISYNAGYVLPWLSNPNSYPVLPDDIIMAANKLCGVEMMKSKGMMAKILSDRDPNALTKEAWDDLAPYQKIR